MTSATTPRRSAALLRALPLAPLLLLSGCMTARLEENRSMTTQITADEGIVILAKPHVEGVTAEDEFMDCVGRKLASSRAIRVHGNDEFMDLLFPWFEPSTAPQRAEGMVQLLNRPAVAQRITETGVRYVVWLDGATRKTDGGGGMSCAIGPGGGGCIGFGWWEKESDYEATVWDLQQGKSAGSVATNVTGTSALVGVIVPIPFIARVQGTACDRLSGQLGSFLKGEDASAPPTG